MATRRGNKNKGEGKPDRPGRQFAALPFLRRNGETLVVLVTSRETHRWVLPKGWAEKRLTGPELAAKEAFEEAGLVGEIASDPAGSYGYLKRLPGGRALPCDVHVFPLRVERLLDDWPERRQRERRWFTLAEAAMAVEEGGLVTLLLRLAAPEAWTAARDPSALTGVPDGGGHGPSRRPTRFARVARRAASRTAPA